MLKSRYCDYMNSHPSSLKLHTCKQTGGMLQCQHCDFSTNRNDLLKTHSQKHIVRLRQRSLPQAKKYRLAELHYVCASR